MSSDSPWQPPAQKPSRQAMLESKQCRVAGGPALIASRPDSMVDHVEMKQPLRARGAKSTGADRNLSTFEPASSSSGAAVGTVKLIAPGVFYIPKFLATRALQEELLGEFDRICGWDAPSPSSGSLQKQMPAGSIDLVRDERELPPRAAFVRTTTIFGKVGFMSCYVQSAGLKWTYESKLKHGDGAASSQQAAAEQAKRLDSSAQSRSASTISKKSRPEGAAKQQPPPREQVAQMPASFRRLYHLAIGMCGASPACFSPRAKADLCFCNLYPRNWGKMGWHSDRDESKTSLERGDPVVSLSVGDAAEFTLFIPKELDAIDASLYMGNADEAKASKISGRVSETGGIAVYFGRGSCQSAATGGTSACSDASSAKHHCLPVVETNDGDEVVDLSDDSETETSPLAAAASSSSSSSSTMRPATSRSQASKAGSGERACAQPRAASAPQPGSKRARIEKASTTRLRAKNHPQATGNTPKGSEGAGFAAANESASGACSPFKRRRVEKTGSNSCMSRASATQSRASKPITASLVKPGLTCRFKGPGKCKGRVVTVLLKSGDCLVFGGHARLVYHGIRKIVGPVGRPQGLRMIDGRLNVTLRCKA